MLKMLPVSNWMANASSPFGPRTVPCLPAIACGPVRVTRCPGWNNNSSSSLDAGAELEDTTGAAETATAAGDVPEPSILWTSMLKMLPVSNWMANAWSPLGPMTVPCLPAIACGPVRVTRCPGWNNSSSSSSPDLSVELEVVAGAVWETVAVTAGGTAFPESMISGMAMLKMLP